MERRDEPRTRGHLFPLVLVVHAALGGGCGEQQTGDSSDSGVGFVDASTDARSGEAASDAGALDAGYFACGDAMCAASQICLYPPCGCVVAMEPTTDAGACPDGSVYYDAAGFCFVPPDCPAPSCVSPAPGEGSFDCSGAGAGPGCDVVNAPIPSSCSRTCRGICA